jgi:ABC-type lipopolysaccharide export system ATPase subunit
VAVPYLVVRRNCTSPTDIYLSYLTLIDRSNGQIKLDRQDFSLSQKRRRTWAVSSVQQELSIDKFLTESWRELRPYIRALVTDRTLRFCKFPVLV